MMQRIELHLDTDTIGAFSDAEIEEFQAAIRYDCHAELDRTQAWNRLTELIWFFRLLSGRLPESPEPKGPGVRTSSNLPWKPKLDSLSSPK